MIRRVILGGFLMSAAMLAGCAQLTNQGHAFEGQSFDANSRDALVIVGVTVARNRTSLGLTYPVYWATWSVNSGPSGHSDPKRSFQVNFAPASIPEDRMNDAVAPMQYRVFDVHPGKYSLAGLRVEGAGGSSILVDQRYTTSFSPHSFSVAKGEAVYIGNFIYDNGKFEPVARDNAAASKMLARYAKPSVVLISR